MSALTEPPFRPHTVAWTPAKIARFWDARARLASDTESYFSWQVGDSLIDVVQEVVPLRRARVLDYGSGPGFLVDKLIRRGITAAGLDTSPASVDALEARLRDRPGFLGALLSNGIPNSVPDNAYDVVFLLETLEHLLPEQIEPTFVELHRIIREHGYLVLTTPNEENLELFQQICPDCGARFHYMQHLTSWSAGRLTDLLHEHGFRPRFVKAITLLPHTRLAPFRALAARLIGSHPLNLIAIGVKQ
jgi:SAM-dependent methyltransferase